MTAMLLTVATVLAEGAFGVYSPDGRRLAYQAETNGLVQVAVRELSTGATTWISAGPGEGFYPAWTRDGAVIYTYGHETGTAYEHRRDRKSGGYNLYRWKNGRSVRITSGRCRDMLASAAPDGSVWYTTTRGLSGTTDRALMVRDKLVRRVKGGATEDIRVANQSNCGIHSASVSPDGRKLLWAEISHLRGTWRICAAPLDRASTTRPCALTPDDANSYAPRWHPNGRIICYTACKEGDAGWCVYAQDLATGAETRLAEGRHPCFSPDGRKILYDQGGLLYERPFEPSAPASGPRPCDRESVSYYRCTVHVRPGLRYVDTRRSDAPDTHPLFSICGRGEEKGRLVFHLKNGRPMLHSYETDGTLANVAVRETCPQNTNIVFTCVRTDRSLSIFRAGRLIASRTFPGGLVPLVGDPSPKVSSSDDVRVTDFSFGRGMPDGLEPAVTRAELLGGGK